MKNLIQKQYDKIAYNQSKINAIYDLIDGETPDIIDMLEVQVTILRLEINLYETFIDEILQYQLEEVI